MENIEKALRDLEKVVKSNQYVTSIKVTITIKKPKPQGKTKELK